MLRLKVLLLLFQIISIVLAELEHQQIGTIKYGVKLEPFHHVIKRQANQPFRITFYYDDSVQTGLATNTKSRIQNIIVPRLKTFLESALMVRPTNAPILLERDCTNNKFFPSNTSLPIRCSTTCANVTMCGPLIQVPSNHLKRCVQCNGSSSSCEEVGTDGIGVSNTDFLLYVSAIDLSGTCVSNSDGSSPSTIAFAASCQMESSLDRPIAGYVNFCPSAFTNTNDDTLFIIVKHEILHALAFSSSLFPFWRDSDGNPRTNRDEFGSPPRITENGLYVMNVGVAECSHCTETWALLYSVECGNGTRFAWNDTTTIREVTYDDWEVFNGTTTHNVTIMVTPNVVKEGRRHFNCSSLEGVELENQGGSGTALSHWEKRILGNEIMTGIIGDGPVISNFTFALLKDSGWYEVNNAYAEYLSWGKDAGCTFATSSCLQYMNERRDVGLSITPFCNQPSAVGDATRRGCTVDRDFGALCTLMTIESGIPDEYRYFSNPNEGGTVIIADYCPYQKSFTFTDGRGNECSNPNNQPPEMRFTSQNVLSETYGNGSKCFNHDDRWTLRGNTINLFGAGCYLYSCNAKNTELTVYVRDIPYLCQQPDDIVKVDVNSGGNVGKLACPSSFDRLCQEAAVFVPVAAPTVIPTPSPTNIRLPVNPPPASGSDTSTFSLVILVTMLVILMFV